jgi:hypothetical protein
MRRRARTDLVRGAISDDRPYRVSLAKWTLGNSCDWQLLLFFSIRDLALSGHRHPGL